jgi:DNA mismatch repair protein MutS2
VAGDLSTFSGHLVVCREMLRSTREFEGTSLVLLDEIGTGTDPAQGAALAQAVLEELVVLGSRVIVTTHYQRVKEMAAGNPKFKVAAMEFIDNRPTYRLRMGSVGESYALETARRMMLPENVLERANSLLDDETKRLLALQQRLEEEIERARKKQTELEEEIKELDGREKKIAEEAAKLEVEIAKLREGRTDEFLVELRGKERELEVMMRRVSEMVSAPVQNATRAERERIIEEARSSVKGVRLEVEKEVVEQVAEDLATPLVPGEPVDEGQVRDEERHGLYVQSKGWHIL